MAAAFTCNDKPYVLREVILRRDTSARWNSLNPRLCRGEFGWDETVGNFKIGNGSDRWNALPFFNTTAGSAHIIQDEGISFTPRANLNFVGATVTITDDPDNNATVVTITSAAVSGGIEITEVAFPGVIALITDSSKYNDAYGNPGATLGGAWNAAVPSGPSEHDYYIETPTNDGLPKHVITFLKKSGTLKPNRIPYIY